jgi:hypothetical protein
MLEPEDLMTDPALQADTIQRAARANDTAYKFEKVTAALDQQVEDILSGNTRNPRAFTEQDVADMLNLPLEDVETIRKRQEVQKRFAEYIPVGERDELRKGWYGKAYRVAEKNYEHVGANVTAAMQETFRLFEEYLSPEEQEKTRGAVRALDVGLFLKFVAVAMKRSATVMAA